MVMLPELKLSKNNTGMRLKDSESEIPKLSTSPQNTATRD